MSLKSPTSALQFESRNGCSATRMESCFLVRHTPHPRRVCHIKGLNNIPICTVNDDEDSLGTWGVGQFNHFEKDEIPSARCSHPPSTAPPESPVRVSPAPNSITVPPPRPHSDSGVIDAKTAKSADMTASDCSRDPVPVFSLMDAVTAIKGALTDSVFLVVIEAVPLPEPCRKIKEYFKTSSKDPLAIKKEEIEVKTPPSPPKACSTARSCSSEVTSTKTNVKNNTVCIPNYLDQEIKILAKLCHILRTDSLAEVLQWLLHASSREKEWVSALIHAELAEINLLAGPGRRNALAETTAMTGKPARVKLPSDSPVKSKVLTRSREGQQPTRMSSQGSEENKEVPKEAQKTPPMVIRRNKMTIPVAEYFSKPKSPPRPKTQESMSIKPMSARCIQQGYNLSPQKTFSPLTYQR